MGEENSGRISARLLIAIFLISVSTLTLEVLQIRVFSYILWHHLAYLVITVALLGFGASGAFLSVFPSLLERDWERLVTLSCVAFGLSTVLSFFAATRIPLDLWLPTLEKRYLYVFLYYALLLVPYFLAGLTIAVLLTKEVRNVNTLYFFNLLGSGVGCLIVFPLLNFLGGEQAVVVAAAIGALGGVMLCVRRSWSLRLAAGGSTLLLICLIPFATKVIKVSSSSSKRLGQYVWRYPDLKWEFSRWHPIARIDVVSSEEMNEVDFSEGKAPHKTIMQDGDAGTYMFHFEEDFEDVDYLDKILYGAAYFVKANPEVLIIGLGGGLDVATALHFGAKKITGVEINPLMIEMVAEKFAEYAGRPYDRENVTVVCSEGRSFVRRSQDTYDIIQMTGVDTWTGLASGAYVLSENYLYTEEAFEDYLVHLNDDGVLAIMRFLMNPPGEFLRLCTVGISVLRQMGIENPQDHFVVIHSKPIGSMLLKKSPFTPEEIDTIRQRVADAPLLELVYAPGLLKDNIFGKYFNSVRWGTDDFFLDDYIYDVSPVTDDNPFFFEHYRWGVFLRTLRGSRTVYEFGFGPPTVQQPFALYILLASLAQAAVLVLVLIVGPLLKFRRDGLKTKGSLRWCLYFFCLGCGFMFVEIGLMQKLVLFLGSPIHSIAITLSALLVFSGLGSLAAGKLRAAPFTIVLGSIVSIAVILAIYLFLLPVILTAALGWAFPLRVIVTTLLVAPLGVAMGMPFPTGLKMVEEHSINFVPWAWGINGGASVLSSIVCIIVAMGAGFNVVLMAAAGIYAIGLIALAMLRRGTRLAAQSAPLEL